MAKHTYVFTDKYGAEIARLEYDDAEDERYKLGGPSLGLALIGLAVIVFCAIVLLGGSS